MVDQLQPTRPGYNLSTADLTRVRLTPAEVTQVILQRAASGQAPDATSLLANLTKQQQQRGIRYQVHPFYMPDSVSVGTQQQILPVNPLRRYLQISMDLNGGTASLGVLFNEGPLTPSPLDLNSYLALFAVSLQIPFNNASNPFIVPPINAVTIVANTLGIGGFASGVVIEGIS